VFDGVSEYGAFAPAADEHRKGPPPDSPTVEAAPLSSSRGTLPPDARYRVRQGGREPEESA